MKRIYKYPLLLQDVAAINVPGRWRPLSVGSQYIDGINRLCLWAEIEDDAAMPRLRRVIIVGTGNPFPLEPWHSSIDFVGTVQMDGCVWHVYAEVR